MFGRGQRDELDDEEGVKLAAAIRKELESDLDKMGQYDADGEALLGKL